MISNAFFCRDCPEQSVHNRTIPHSTYGSGHLQRNFVCSVAMSVLGKVMRYRMRHAVACRHTLWEARYQALSKQAPSYIGKEIKWKCKD